MARERKYASVPLTVFSSITSNAVVQISAVLTPEQRARFEKFREEQRQILEPK
jgi:hypothetical protein